MDTKKSAYEHVGFLLGYTDHVGRDLEDPTISANSGQQGRS